MQSWTDLSQAEAASWESKYLTAVNANVASQPPSRLAVIAPVEIIGAYPDTCIVARLRIGQGPEFVERYPLWTDSYQGTGAPENPDVVALTIVTEIFENTACGAPKPLSAT